MRGSYRSIALALCLGSISTVAQAQEDGSDTAASASGTYDIGWSEPEPSRPGWFERFRPQPWTAEIGLVYGLLFPAADHNFHTEDRPHQKVNRAGPNFGIRAGYYPREFVGGEFEGMLAPTSTEDGVGATIWSVRGHAVVQLPVWRLTPFVLAGGGRMGMLSNPNGNDSDPLLHYGGGLRFGVTDLLVVRVDVRDNLTQRNGGVNGPAEDGDLTHHPEVLGSLAVRFYPRKPAVRSRPPQPEDSDNDGYFDSADACPDQAGVAPVGCPRPDTDGDLLPDDMDVCPRQKGVAPHGCPDSDRDADGFYDHEDKCPDELGVSPDGCPIKDADQDGLADSSDKCPAEPETRNGIDDADGCPDVLPESVEKFMGVAAGLAFEGRTEELQAASGAILDELARVLQQYPGLRLRITGYTDNRGKETEQIELSQQRAESVKTYLGGKGVDPERMVTQGRGAERPRASNATAKGRQQNNRIEFEFLPPPTTEETPAADDSVERGPIDTGI